MPVLSRISMVAIAVCSAAMIIIFSAFNGIEALIKHNCSMFYPDIRVSAAKGKFFAMDEAMQKTIGATDGVEVVTTAIEDNVFADNHGQQKVIVLKGIERNYFEVNDIRDSIVQGDDTVSAGHPYTGIGGSHLLNELGIDVDDVFAYTELFYPNPRITNPELDPLNAYQTLRLHPSGRFRIQDDFDSKYLFTPLSLAQKLFAAEGRYSSIEIKTKPGVANKVSSRLKELLGQDWKVETRSEQNKTLYMIISTEKWAIYAIMVMVLLIATFNMVGALSMLVLEKQKDIAILRAMGATDNALKIIFRLEGILWSLVGGVAGILIGTLTVVAQKQFGLVKVGAEGSLIDTFPVALKATDDVLVFIALVGIALLMSWYPSVRAARAVDPTLKST